MDIPDEVVLLPPGGRKERKKNDKQPHEPAVRGQKAQNLADTVKGVKVPEQAPGRADSTPCLALLAKAGHAGDAAFSFPNWPPSLGLNLKSAGSIAPGR